MKRRRTALVTGLVTMALAVSGNAIAAAPDQEATAAAEAASFTDIGPGDTFYTEVQWMADSGISTGFPDGTFRPTAPVTREATAAFLGRWSDMRPEPCDPADTRTFSDVTAGHPFCDYIELLALFAIQGYPDGTFRPGATLTREAFAAILMRGYLGDAACDPETPRTFSDVTIGHPFCGYIEEAAERGFVNGWSDGTFRPGLNIERQAMAAILYRASELEGTGPALSTWAADAD